MSQTIPPDHSISPATLAREALRLSLEQAARRVRICPAYLKRVERSGGASYLLARRLSALYGCPIHSFLHADLGGGTPRTPTPRRSRNRRGVDKPPQV